jgi:hypothetical protein
MVLTCDCADAGDDPAARLGTMPLHSVHPLRAGASISPTLLSATLLLLLPKLLLLLCTTVAARQTAALQVVHLGGQVSAQAGPVLQAGLQTSHQAGSGTRDTCDHLPRKPQGYQGFQYRVK